MTVADLAIIAGLVFAWGTLSARLERFDVTAPIVFTAAGDALPGASRLELKRHLANLARTGRCSWS